jgi:hypothetical protein
VWRELLSKQYPDAEFSAPALVDELQIAHSKIGMPFPSELNDLYNETNGVYRTEAYLWIVWALDELIQENQYMHTSPDLAFYERSFDDLLFFGSLGTGDLLAFRRDSLSTTYLAVGIWNHETGEFEENSLSLRDFFSTNS